MFERIDELDVRRRVRANVEIGWRLTDGKRRASSHSLSSGQTKSEERSGSRLCEDTSLGSVCDEWSDLNARFDRRSGFPGAFSANRVRVRREGRSRLDQTNRAAGADPPGVMGETGQVGPVR